MKIISIQKLGFTQIIRKGLTSNFSLFFFLFSSFLSLRKRSVFYAGSLDQFGNDFLSSKQCECLMQIWLIINALLSAAGKKIINIQKLRENNNGYTTKNLDITKYYNAVVF